MAGNLGRAVMSIGDDVTRYSLEASRDARERQLAQMRDQRERDIAELRAELQMALRGGGAASRGRGGVMDSAFGALPDEELARTERAVSGLDEPRRAAARARDERGADMEVKMRADDPAAAYLDDADRQDLQAAGGMKGETLASQAAARDLPAYRRGVMATRFAQQHLDDVQKGVTTATTRDDVYGGTDVAEAGRRAAATKGEGAFRHSNSDVTRDEFTGDTEMTPLGTARGKAAEALERDRDASARKDDRTDPNRPRGGGAATGTPEYKAAEQLFKAAETEQAKAEADMSKAQDALQKAIGDALTPAAAAESQRIGGERIAKAERRIAEARAVQAAQRARMDEIARGTPTAQAGKTPAADKFQVGKVYRDAQGNRATYRGNGQWEPAR